MTAHLFFLGLVCINNFQRIHIDGLVHDCSISIANALDILQFGTKPSICRMNLILLRYYVTVTQTIVWLFQYYPGSKVDVANMGPTWVLSAPGVPHVGPMNLAIRVVKWPWRVFFVNRAVSNHNNTEQIWTTRTMYVLSFITLLLGLYSLRRRRLISVGVPIINLGRSSDRLRFIMGIPIPVRRRLLSG